MVKRVTRTLVFSAIVGAASMSQAIVFSSVIVASPPLSNGSSFSTAANAITFFTPNAIVGDPVAPLRAGTLNIQYDADSTVNMIANQVNVNLGTALSGSGFVVFNEIIMELAANGNELGQIGSISHVFLPNSSMTYTGTINFSKQVRYFRAKKSFTLSAAATNNFDLAAVAIVNQNIQTVPEPSAFVALGLGIGAVLARRRKK